MNYNRIKEIKQPRTTKTHPYWASINLQAAVNATELPEDIIIHLALSGATQSDLPRANPSFSADDIFEIKEAIERHNQKNYIDNENTNQTNN